MYLFVTHILSDMVSMAATIVWKCESVRAWIPLFCFVKRIKNWHRHTVRPPHRILHVWDPFLFFFFCYLCMCVCVYIFFSDSDSLDRHWFILLFPIYLDVCRSLAYRTYSDPLWWLSSPTEWKKKEEHTHTLTLTSILHMCVEFFGRWAKNLHHSLHCFS